MFIMRTVAGHARAARIHQRHCNNSRHQRTLDGCTSLDNFGDISAVPGEAAERRNNSTHRYARYRSHHRCIQGHHLRQSDAAMDKTLVSPLALGSRLHLQGKRGRLHTHHKSSLRAHSNALVPQRRTSLRNTSWVRFGGTSGGHPYAYSKPNLKLLRRTNLHLHTTTCCLRQNLPSMGIVPEWGSESEEDSACMRAVHRPKRTHLHCNSNRHPRRSAGYT